MVWKSKYNNHLQILDGLIGGKGQIYLICEDQLKLQGVDF